MEKEYVVISALGADRLGIVDDIASIIVSLNCNIEESKMAVLGGEFAVIMLVSGSATGIQALQDKNLTQWQSLGLHIEIRATKAPRYSQGRPYVLESFSLDTPGILHSLTAVLKSEGINIEDLETETTAAPWTGAPMFKMRIRFSLAPEKALAPFRRLIEELAEQQDLDIRLDALTGFTPE